MFIYGSDRLGGKMDINGFIEELDSLYTERRINDVEPFFNESIEQAKKENDLAAQFTILNEMMGFFRDTSQFEKSIKACNDCIELMKKMGIEGTVDYATSLQNVANAYRAAGKLAESLEVYKALGLDKLDCSVAIIKNVKSNKMGKKDILKIDEEFALDLDVLGYLDPNITVCIIKDGKLVEKKKLQLPQKIINVEKCKNPRCITSVEQGLDHVFYLANKDKRIYRCLYCETKVEKK